MKTPEEAATALEALQRRTPGRLILAFGVLTAAVALALMAILFTREQRHLEEARILNAKVSQLNAQNEQLLTQIGTKLTTARSNPARSGVIIDQALQQTETARATSEEAKFLDLKTPNIARPAEPFNAPPPEPAPGTLVVARGPVTGWDIDVFWCDGALMGQNYETARAVAAVLGTAALENEKVGEGVALGRVRLRSAKLDGEVNWFRGQHVISDGGIGEEDAAAALVKYLGAKQIDSFSVANSKTAQTRYYLSVFACNPRR